MKISRRGLFGLMPGMAVSAAIKPVKPKPEPKATQNEAVVAFDSIIFICSCVRGYDWKSGRRGNKVTYRAFIHNVPGPFSEHAVYVAAGCGGDWVKVESWAKALANNAKGCHTLLVYGRAPLPDKLSSEVYQHFSRYGKNQSIKSEVIDGWGS